MTGADVLSTLRIAIALVIAGVATAPSTQSASALTLLAFACGVATDIVGGLLGPRDRTPHGRVLDSLADKALVYAVLIPLARSGVPPPVLLLPLMARDAVAVALHVVAARQRTLLHVGTIGKLKTAILYCACAAPLTLDWMLGGSGPVTVDPGDLGTILPFLLLSQLAIVLATLLSFVTLYRYILTLWPRGTA